jgi:putative endonuclease
LISWPRRKPAAPETSGAHAEQLAADYLRKQGLTLHERNFSCKQGELDLVMEDGGTLVFVEVRYRKSARFGSAAETVTLAKQAKLLLAAQMYLLQHPKFNDNPSRFDVVGVTPGVANSHEFTWLKNAFDGSA